MNPLGPVIIPQMRESNVIMGYCFFPFFHQRLLAISRRRVSLIRSLYDPVALGNKQPPVVYIYRRVTCYMAVLYRAIR